MPTTTVLPLTETQAPKVPPFGTTAGPANVTVWMCVGMYLCKKKSMYVSACAYVHLCAFVCIYVHLWSFVCICVHLCVWVRLGGGGDGRPDGAVVLLNVP